MDEVDSIIIYTLKEIGCDVGSKVSELGTNQIFDCVKRCFELIKPEVKISNYDQNISMSSRYKLASEIAQSITDIGYKEEIGCQSFLYPTEAETRKLLIFFIEKLPKVHQSNSEFSDKIETLLSKIAQENEDTNPIFGTGHTIHGIQLPTAVDVDSLPKETLRFYASHLADITFEKQREKFRKNKTKSEDSPKKEIIIISDEDDDDNWGDPDMPEEIVEKPKIEEEKPKIAQKPPKPPLKPKPSIEKTDSISENEKREAEDAALKLKQIQDQVKKKATEVIKREKSIKSFNKQIDSLETELKRLRNEIDSREKHLFRKNKTQELLMDNSEDGLEKVKKAIDNQKEKILNLSNKWETHRQPIIDVIRTNKALNRDKISETKKKKEEIRLLKSRLKEMGVEAKSKAEIYEQLLNEYERMPKDLNRSAYTKRISEIIGNIKKQKKEITKVLNDTKDIQKEINTLSGSLGRTFAVADEIIFKDAEKDKNVAQSYKLLINIHADFTRLIKVLEEIGNLKRHGRDLEDKLDIEKEKNVEGKLERLKADLSQMKKENQILQALLRDPTLKKNQNQELKTAPS